MSEPNGRIHTRAGHAHRLVVVVVALSAAGCSEGTGTPSYDELGLPGAGESSEPAPSAGPGSAEDDATSNAPSLLNDFVTRNGTELEVAGQPFRFAGSNNYYLMYTSPFMVDDVLEAAQRTGFNTLRTWGFLDIGNQDGSDSVRGPSNGVYFQYWGGSAPVYNDGPNGLERLDYIIRRAGQLGIRLVIPLVNNWNDFGGIDQYVRWRDSADTSPREWFHDDFYTDPEIRGWYQAWITHVLERVNPLTGIAYKDDPAIAMWELGNEPRCTGAGVYGRSPNCTTQTLTEWADVMSAHVRSVDPNHLIAVGDEGFYCVEDGMHWTEQCGDGVDSIALARLPNIDVMSAHLYPEAWGTSPDWGTDWITRHVNDAKANGKASLLGEFGLSNQRVRNRVYQAWTDNLVSLAGNGGLYWILSGRNDDGSLYGDFDGFTIYEGTPTFQTLTNFALSMIAGAPGQYAPVADHDVGYLTHDTSAVFDPFANDVAYGQDPSTLLIDLDLEAPGVQGSLSVDGHTIETRAEGGLAFTPSPGFVGRVDLPYRAIDAAERESNEAILGIIVSPDPTPLTSFEAGADGWVAQNPMNGGTAVQSSAFATEGAFSLEVTGTTNNWFGRVYDQPLDLSARRAIRYDVQTLGDDTQTAVRVFFGEVRCQSPFGDVPANTTTQVEIDMVNLNCDGLRPADGRATSLYL
jgi:mannan endo-1,4-beta-mannosidase